MSPLWQIALDHSASGILVLQALDVASSDAVTFRLALTNRRASELTGVKLNLLLGRSVSTLFPDDWSAALVATAQRVWKTGRTEEYDQAYSIRRTGNTGWFQITLTTAGDGKHVVVSINDITEMRKAKLALLKKAYLFNTMSRNVPDAGALVVGPDLRVILANGELPADLFPGLDQKALIGMPIAQVLGKAFQSEMTQYFDDALTGLTRSLIQPIGERVYEVFVGPVNDETGETLMTMAIYRDITLTRRYHRQMEQSIVELKRSNESLEQFAYVASHDLQEPLRKIQSFGDVLSDQYAQHLGENGVDLVARMQSAAFRMSGLIRDLLTYSKLATEHQTQQAINLNTVLTDVITDLEVTLRDKQACVESTDLPVIKGDPAQLRRVFQNLLSNALKFIKAGVRPYIHITSRQVAGTAIPNVALSDEHQLFYEISFSDNGIGFDERYLDRIFVIFQRLHGRNQYAGTGIGLAICKKVMDNHRGYIRASSRVGEGATFRIYLPT
ncbi:hypothetical protein GCM10023187_01690 [Nibrella viscosa]|uniref:histidine kinase n=1 Tax=Nibrella viscosa TaxID=1084524 RepID=A0ABP8JSK0_9BACT